MHNFVQVNAWVVSWPLHKFVQVNARVVSRPLHIFCAHNARIVQRWAQKGVSWCAQKMCRDAKNIMWSHINASEDTGWSCEGRSVVNGLSDGFKHPLWVTRHWRPLSELLAVVWCHRRRGDHRHQSKGGSARSGRDDELVTVKEEQSKKLLGVPMVGLVFSKGACLLHQILTTVFSTNRWSTIIGRI